MKFNLNPDNIECIPSTTMDMAYLDKVLGEGRRVIISPEHAEKVTKQISKQYEEASQAVKNYAVRMKISKDKDDIRDAVAMLKSLAWLNTWVKTHVCQPIPKLGQNAHKKKKA